jgi:hypothetical protein
MMRLFPNASSALPVDARLDSPDTVLKILAYHWSVKPSQRATERELLNENTTKTTIGAHKKK